jgi:hypothetical protein
MREIPLTRGHIAIVDDEDFFPLLKWKWHSDGRYARRADYPNRNLIWMHRHILLAPSVLDVDHINGNGFDNRRANIRACLPSENTKNRKISKNNKSGYKGVIWSKKGTAWSASIGVNNKRLHLGYYQTKEEAAMAYNNAAKILHGEFAKLNII